MIIGIDPGANGAIAYDNYDITYVAKMPKTVDQIYKLLYKLVLIADGHESIHCFLEKVGGYVEGNAATAAVKFARHNGHLDMALVALGIKTSQVAPAVWMRKVLGGNILYPIGLTISQKKTYRKNIIKQTMQDKYPQIKVTLTSADALGILDYGNQIM